MPSDADGVTSSRSRARMRSGYRTPALFLQHALFPLACITFVVLM